MIRKLRTDVAVGHEPARSGKACRRLVPGLGTSAIDARSDLVLDQYAPLPDPAAEDWTDGVGRRDTLAGVIGRGGSWRTFQTTVVIAAPLLTALIGSAIGA